VKALLAAVACFAAAALLTRRLQRYEVGGRSMAPTLLPGDWVLATRGLTGACRPKPGHVVLARDPREPSRLLLKRVLRLTPDGAWLEGDNPAESTDSRHFGPVPRALVLGRVLLRYWPWPCLL
jgi:nickel-type superoxide dismutase maturation protease